MKSEWALSWRAQASQGRGKKRRKNRKAKPTDETPHDHRTAAWSPTARRLSAPRKKKKDTTRNRSFRLSTRSVVWATTRAVGAPPFALPAIAEVPTPAALPLPLPPPVAVRLIKTLAPRWLPLPPVGRPVVPLGAAIVMAVAVAAPAVAVSAKAVPLAYTLRVAVPVAAAPAAAVAR